LSPAAATIRLAQAGDAAQIADIYAPFVTAAATSFETEAPSAAEMSERIERTLHTHPWLVCARGGDVLGYAYAGPHAARAAYRWSVDVSVYVAATARRSGVGAALYTSLLELLRLQGFVTAYAGITLPNLASVGLHEALGFIPAGVFRNAGHKLGAWHDVGWWQRTIQPAPPESPADPIAPAEASLLPGWDTAMHRGFARRVRRVDVGVVKRHGLGGWRGGSEA
jgi:phosphinothricin acetyltransferase